MNRTPRIDQFMAGFATGDATSGAALVIRDQLRTLGFPSDIYAPAAYVMPAIRSECRDLADYSGTSRDLVIHHFGLWSDATEAVLKMTGRKVLIYHNITPGHFFRGYHDATAERLDRSRSRLPEAAEACDLLWADSHFNAAELQAVSDKPVRVFSLPFYSRWLDTPPDAERVRRLTAPVVTLLSVGRMAPNKRLEELIRAFACYRRLFNPFSRLLLVGSDRSSPRYVTYLKLLAHELKVSNVCFEGFVWPDALAAYYQLADVYLSASDHEGYCLPLLEAMCMGVPAIGKQSGGTPEAMRDAGILYEGLTPRQLARLIHEVVTDPRLQSEVRASQDRRVREEQARDIARELRSLLEPLIS